MFRACELKDQTYKKTRTLHFSDQKLSELFLEFPFKTGKTPEALSGKTPEALRAFPGPSPVRLGLSEKFQKDPGSSQRKDPRSSQSFSWAIPLQKKQGWDPPSPMIQGISNLQSIPALSPPPQCGWGRLFLQSPPKGAGKPVPRENCRKVLKNILTLPNLYPLAGDDRALWPYSNGAVQIRSWVWSSLIFSYGDSEKHYGRHFETTIS